jgi:endonuclease-8
MPEGDTIHRAAAVLHAALAGAVVTRFEGRTAELAGAGATLAGRTVERVEAAGKHLVVRFSQGLALRTHMRMNGSWHLYRRGERWRRPGFAARFVLETAEWQAVGFDVPEAELVRADALARTAVGRLGPDLLADAFDAEEALRRLGARPERLVADALLDQRVMAGIGNVFRNEIMFLAGLAPARRVAELAGPARAALVALARRELLRNAPPARHATAPRPRAATRRTRTALDGRPLWVYGRSGEPCLRCGTAIRFARSGAGARGTYWCPTCQR